jgi:hypothetical protein
VVVVLAGVVGAAIAGGQPVDRLTAQAAAATAELDVDYVPRPSPWAVRRATIDPATFDGAGALAATGFVIPPPRWIAARRPSVLTARVGGLGWRTDPYAK